MVDCVCGPRRGCIGSGLAAPCGQDPAAQLACAPLRHEHTLATCSGTQCLQRGLVRHFYSSARVCGQRCMDSRLHLFSTRPSPLFPPGRADFLLRVVEGRVSKITIASCHPSRGALPWRHARAMSQDARGSWAESSRLQKPFGHPWHQARTLEARSKSDLQKAAATWELTAHRDRHNERGAAPHLPSHAGQPRVRARPYAAVEPLPGALDEAMTETRLARKFSSRAGSATRAW